MFDIPPFFGDERSQPYSQQLAVPLLVYSGRCSERASDLAVLYFEGVKIGQEWGQEGVWFWVKGGTNVVKWGWRITSVDFLGVYPPLPLLL